MSDGFAGLHSWPLALPGVLPEGIFQRRIGDGSSAGLVGTNALLECKRRVERDGIPGRVRNSVCQQNDLNLLLSEAAAVDLLKDANEGVDEFW